VHESVLVGAGPRATQALLLAGRAHAAIAGRDFVHARRYSRDGFAGVRASTESAAKFEIEGLGTGEVVQKILGDIQATVQSLSCL